MDAEDWLSQAREYQARGDWAQAERIYLQQERIDLALPLLEYTHLAFPDHIELGFELAQLRVAAGYIDQAADLFRQLAHRCLDAQESESAMKAFFMLDLLKPR